MGGEYRRGWPERYTTDQASTKGIVESATASLKRCYDAFEGVLGNGPHFLGTEFSILDLYVWMLVQWRSDHDQMRHDHPKTLRLVETVMERPKIKPVHEQQFGAGLGFG